MKILMVHNNHLPALKYGGRERGLWWLARELHQRGHEITLMAPQGSYCDFARVLVYDMTRPVDEQIPDDIDLVHVHFYLKEEITKKPHVVTIGGNGKLGEAFAHNSIFLTANHAQRHGGKEFVFNGIDTNDYGPVDFSKPRKHIHFLAKAAWRIKNVKGAIQLARMSGHKLEVIGGKRLNIKMGFRFTPDLNVHFNGMQGGEKKLNVLRQSGGLLFPVLWHEPFGIAIIESMYYGCPVFATPWGSLPEIVAPGMGHLSASYSELAESMKNLSAYNRKAIHEHVCDNFSVKNMTDGYYVYYEKVLNGEMLHTERPKVKTLEPEGFFSMTE